MFIMTRLTTANEISGHDLALLFLQYKNSPRRAASAPPDVQVGQSSSAGTGRWERKSGQDQK